MPVRQIARYQVKPTAVEPVKAAIDEFVHYIRAHEPGTRLYKAWQQQDDPTRFAHLFIFEDAAAQKAHGQSQAVQKFKSVYTPELVGGPVQFVNYEAIAEKPEYAATDAAHILRQFYDAVIKRDFSAARRCLADDMVFVGLFETYPNADAYIRTLTGLMSITTRLEIKTIVGTGDQAAVFFELDTTAPAEATTLVAEWHQTRAGKIVRAQSAFDGRPFEKMFTKQG